MNPFDAIVKAEEQAREEEEEALEKYLRGTEDAPTLYRSFVHDIRAVEDSDEAATLNFVISDETKDRYGDIIRVSGWQLAQFKKNPVVLWGHNSVIPAIAKASNVRKDLSTKELLSSATFDMDDAFAANIYRKYKNGYLKAVSVGFKPIEFKYLDKTDDDIFWFRPREYLKQELMEFSGVDIPANPNALMKMFSGVPVVAEPESTEETPTKNSLTEIELRTIFSLARMNIGEC